MHGDASLLRRIDRELGKLRLADVTPEDVERLKDALADRPIMANRCLSLLSTLLNFAIGKKLLAENPCKGIKKFSEPARRVNWDAERTQRLYAALDASDNQRAANVIRLLLWTGARLSEVTGAAWKEFNSECSVWTKPAERMKTRTDHIIPLNALAQPLLREMKREARGDLLFDKPNVRRFWNDLRKRAGLDGLHLHDLRHVFASMALENGVLLAAIAPLLGHSSTAMTQRYSHLSDRALLDASNKAAEMLAPATPAKVRPSSAEPDDLTLRTAVNLAKLSAPALKRNAKVIALKRPPQTKASAHRAPQRCA